MKIFDLASKEVESHLNLCSAESKKSLEASLRALKAGRAPTPSFPLYGKRDISVIEDFLSSLPEGIAPNWMLEYEHSRLRKCGPQGGTPKWDDVKEDFSLYFARPTLPKLSDRDLDILAGVNSKYYKYMNLQPLSRENTLRYLRDADKLGPRAAGWNTFNLKKDEPAAQREALRVAKDYSSWSQGVAYVFTRFNKGKKRIFFPMPFSTMINEAQMYVPFINEIQASLLHLKDRSPFTFWMDKVGFEKGFEIADLMLKHSPIPKGWIPVMVQRDFEKMDTTQSKAQNERLFIPTLKSAFHGKTLDEKVFTFATEIPIITPSGMYTGIHGEASGAETTNGSETCSNEKYDALGHELLLQRLGSDGWTRIFTFGNGDDGASLYFVDPAIYDKFIDQLRSAYAEAAIKCGYRIQADKWHVSRNFGLYCQRMYWIEDSGIRNAYPAVLCLNSIMNPERQYSKRDWDKDYRDLDIIVKLDNCYGLPYFSNLVEYVMQGLKYPLLGSSEDETRRILSKYDRYRELATNAEFFNRQDYDISHSPTVKYILFRR